MSHEISPANVADELSNRVNYDEKKRTSILGDVEADSSSQEDSDFVERAALVRKAEKTELIPVEAFKCDVEGSQSPCESQMCCSIHS